MWQAQRVRFGKATARQSSLSATAASVINRTGLRRIARRVDVTSSKSPPSPRLRRDSLRSPLTRRAKTGGKGIRTPDFQLAKLALYQLSYAPARSPSRTAIRVDGTREIAIRERALRGLGRHPCLRHALLHKDCFAEMVNATTDIYSSG
jgi:hypothetical protein